MSTLGHQLHGYRQGHQLLSSSLKLDKSDQELVDRLSDVAGPLRPGELFVPYLTGYPLPSGLHYVFARSWQDLSVKRAGCVRTISLIIPLEIWANASSLAPYLRQLSAESPELTIETLNLGVSNDAVALSMPRPLNFRADELVEALFLEERKPIVVFDASEPEVIASRLVTALWPSFRSRFAISTFALSPRKLPKRSFDLVFSPKDSRSRFSDWDGRRIDGRAMSLTPRHIWTTRLVESIFLGDPPTLIEGSGSVLLGADESGNEEALRIALLWGDLFDGLDSTPTAILGLLDIANTRETPNLAAIRLLEPKLAVAAEQATAVADSSAAWGFIDALIRKLRESKLSSVGLDAIRPAVVRLARKDPVRAIEALASIDSGNLTEALVASSADGIAQVFTSEAALAFANASPDVIVRLMLGSTNLARKVLIKSPSLLNTFVLALHHVDLKLLKKAKDKLLPLLIDDKYADAAAIMIAKLNGNELLSEVRHLNVANGLSSPSLISLILARARSIGEEVSLRNLLVKLGTGSAIDEVLYRTLEMSQQNVAWLMTCEDLSDQRKTAFLLSMLRSATEAQLNESLSQAGQLNFVLEHLGSDDRSAVVLRKIVYGLKLPLTFMLSVISRLLVFTRGNDAAELARLALDKCLVEEFDGDQLAMIGALLGVIGNELDVRWLSRRAISREVRAEIASRNLIAFDLAPEIPRTQIVKSIDEVARVICERGKADISQAGFDACASMFVSAESIEPRALLKGGSELLPFLLRAKQSAVSSLIAVLFPPVYNALRRGNEQPDMLRLFFYIDWDRCKVARKALVDAFVGSVWNPTDLALAAARADDVIRIFRQLARIDTDDSLLNAIQRNLESIPAPWHDKVSYALRVVRTSESELQDS
jgi:hypothetical protein